MPKREANLNASTFMRDSVSATTQAAGYRQWAFWFIRSATVILLITGIAKVWTAFGNVKLLTVVDPIVGIPFKHLMLGVGVAELIIAAVCLFKGRPALSAAWIAWISLNFLLYRLGLWWMGRRDPSYPFNR